MKPKIHLLVFGGHAACGINPYSSPMIHDPARVDCERCRRTEIFRKVSAGKKQEREKRITEQMELFKEDGK